MKAAAVVCTSVNRVELVEHALMDLAPDEALVQVHYSVISPGTELRCLAGLQPDLGGFGFVPGYAQAGFVVEGPADWIGRRVFVSGSQKMPLPRLWGGHCSHSIVKTPALFLLPDDVPLTTAGFSKMAAIARRGRLLAEPKPGQTVAVVGLGLIGQLSARWFAAAGAQVTAFDLDPKRLQLASRSGIRTVQVQNVEGKPDLIATALSHQPEGFEIVVDATGHAPVVGSLHQIIKPLPWGDHSEPGRKLIVQGSYPATFEVPYQEYFRLEAEILLPRDQRPDDLRQSLSAMAEGVLEVESLVSEIVPASNPQAAYDPLLNRVPGYITSVLDWTEFHSG